MTRSKPRKTAAGEINRLAVEIAAGQDAGPESGIRIRVGGSSMAPALVPGDDVIVVAGAPYRPGEIVTFLDEEGPVTHRVVGELPGAYLTKGDNARSFDPAVPVKAVIGRVVRREARRGDREIAGGSRAALLARVSAAEGRFFQRGPKNEAGLKKTWSLIVHRLFRVTIRILAGT